MSLVRKLLGYFKTEEPNPEIAEIVRREREDIKPIYMDRKTRRQFVKDGPQISKRLASALARLSGVPPALGSQDEIDHDKFWQRYDGVRN